MLRLSKEVEAQTEILNSETENLRITDAQIASLRENAEIEKEKCQDAGDAAKEEAEKAPGSFRSFFLLEIIKR